LQREVAPRFLAWGVANEAALAEGQAQTELQMDGRLYYQRTFKYPASTLAILRRKFERVGEAPDLRRLLQETGCLSALEGGVGRGRRVSVTDSVERPGDLRQMRGSIPSQSVGWSEEVRRAFAEGHFCMSSEYAIYGLPFGQRCVGLGKRVGRSVRLPRRNVEDLP